MVLSLCFSMYTYASDDTKKAPIETNWSSQTNARASSYWSFCNIVRKTHNPIHEMINNYRLFSIRRTPLSTFVQHIHCNQNVASCTGCDAQIQLIMHVHVCMFILSVIGTLQKWHIMHIIYTYLTILSIRYTLLQETPFFLLACIHIYALKSHLGGIDRGCYKITMLHGTRYSYHSWHTGERRVEIPFHGMYLVSCQQWITYNHQVDFGSIITVDQRL